MRIALACLALLALLAGCQDDESCGGADTVDRVVDRDTLDGAACGRIRLALVDTPESGEAGADEATMFTAAMCAPGSIMDVDVDDGQPWDTTGMRRVAHVRCGGASLNGALVAAGHAVVLERFCGVSEFADEPWASPPC